MWINAGDDIVDSPNHTGALRVADPRSYGCKLRKAPLNLYYYHEFLRTDDKDLERGVHAASPSEKVWLSNLTSISRIDAEAT